MRSEVVLLSLAVKSSEKKKVFCEFIAQVITSQETPSNHVLQGLHGKIILPKHTFHLVLKREIGRL